MPRPAQNKVEDSLAPIECVCTSLKMAARAAGRRYDSALAPAGVNAMQYAILANIERREPIAQMRLADHLQLERTTLYRAVDILERRRLVQRVDGEGGADKVLKLTAQGVRVVAKARPLWTAAQAAFVARFGPRRWRELQTLLNGATNLLVGQ